MPSEVPVLVVVVERDSDGCFALSSPCWKQKGLEKRLLKILKMKENGNLANSYENGTICIMIK